MRAMLCVLAVMVTFQCQTAAATSYPVLYVRPGGVATWPCGTSIDTSCKSIATAVSHANYYNTATIKVAQGHYEESILIQNVGMPASSLSDRLSIEGGWNSDFTAQSTDPSTTRMTSPTATSLIEINLNLSVYRVGLRLAYLTFEGTSDLNIEGLAARANTGSTIDLVLEHCRIVRFNGRGLLLNAQDLAHMTVAVDDTIIQNNQNTGSSASGAGIAVFSQRGSDVGITLTKNKIIANHAGSGGGGIYFCSQQQYMDTPSTLTAALVNNILAENQALWSGGAILAFASSSNMNLSLTNNTISDNLAEDSTGGIAFFSYGSAQITADLTNTIVWGSSDPATSSDIFINQYDSSATAVNSYYSMIGVVQGDGVTSSYHGYHNIHLNPALDERYHLGSASPAENKGLCGEILWGGYYERFAPYNDIDGDARPGWNEELGCDIGADEYQFPWVLFNPVHKKKH